MGKIFLDHSGGHKLYGCISCDTNLTNKSELISTRFTGATGNSDEIYLYFFNLFGFSLKIRILI